MPRFSPSGQFGFDHVTSGTINQTDYADGWNAIFAVSESQIDVTNLFGDNLTNFTLPAGQVLYVTATSITLDSGEIICYRNGD